MPNGIVAEQFLRGPKVVLLSYTGEVKILHISLSQKKLLEPRKSSFMNKMAGEWTHKQAGGEKGESSHESASPVIAWVTFPFEFNYAALALDVLFAGARLDFIRD